MKKVGIISGSSFIGSQIAKQFLDNVFDVKVSTTDLSNRDKYKHFQSVNKNLEQYSL